MPPTINSVGSYSHGVGGGNLNLNNVALFAGGNIGWIDDDTIAYASGVDTVGGEWMASTYKVSTGLTARLNPATPSGANMGFAGGGHAAWWWAATSSPYRGLNSTTGFRSTVAGLLGMGPDAAIGYKPNYSATGPSQVRELGGAVWTLTPNHAYDLNLLGKGRALFRDSVTGLKVIGIPMPVTLAGDVGFPQAFPINGVWWLGYWSSTGGVVAHPFTATTPLYTFVALGIDAWPSFRALTNNSFRVVWSSTIAEQAGHMTAVTQTVSGVAAGPIVDPPPADGWTPGGGPVGPTPPPTAAPGPRAVVTPRQRLSRQYPHVEAITDWRAQQTTRLLWDRVFDLEERLQASEQTARDLVPISNSQDETLANISAVAGEALALAQRTQSQGGGGGASAPTTGPGSFGEPIVAMSADPATIASDVASSFAYFEPIAIAAGKSIGTVDYWVSKASHAEQFSNGKWHLGHNKYWEDRMDVHNPGFPSTADPAGGAVPAVH